ncbi:MAG: hypothetical protein FWB95_07355 [Treponema sp.]|nr:hypothetical protein [Treponema sp.]
MTRGIFLAGNESALSRAIEAETVKRVEQYAAAFIPNRLSAGNFVGGSGSSKNSPAENEKRLSLDWNPSSPISARTVVIAAENRLEHIDEAVLICSPPSIHSNAADIPFSDVEIMLNDHIKGWFFLVKELAAIFRNRGRGTLALVYQDIASSGKDDAADVLGPSALASFRALTNGLLAAAHNDKYLTAGFTAADAGNDAAFAAFMYKSIDELTNRNNGKLFKFGKFNFFK